MLELGSVEAAHVQGPPPTKEMTDPFLNSELGLPWGYGLQSRLDFILGGRHAKMILYKNLAGRFRQALVPTLFVLCRRRMPPGTALCVAAGLFSFEESTENDVLFRHCAEHDGGRPRRAADS